MTKPCPRCLGTGRVVDQKALGLKMWRTRYARNITLKDMAKQLGISSQYLYDLEQGKRNWSLKLKAKADRILKV